MNKEMYLGGGLFLLSYLQIFLPTNLTNGFTLMVFLFFFMVGIILLGEGATKKIYKKSLISEVHKNRKNIISFYLTMILGGILLDAIAQWLGKLWIYPYFNIYGYALMFAPGFTVYLLMIAESYLGVKAVIDYLIRGKKIVTTYRSFEPIFYKSLGLIGVLLTTSMTILIIKNYGPAGYVFNVSGPTKLENNFLYIMALFLGTWFIFESIEFYRKKTSLLKDIIHNFYSPLISILLAAFILALIMETENIPKGLWIYTNWPWPDVKFLSLPITMLLAWPLHYIALLSFFRAFTGEESDEIWKGDLVK